MENGKSNGTSRQKKNYDVELFQEYVIGPTKNVIERSATMDNYHRLQDAFAYSRANRMHLDNLEDGMKKNLYKNDPKELEELRDQFKDNIDKLGKQLNDYRQTVKEEVNKISLDNLKKNYLSPDKHELPFDKIKMSYDNPMNDLKYGKLIRELLMDLEELLEVNNKSYVNELKDFVTDLEEEVKCARKEIKICYPESIDIEELNQVEKSLEIFIEILKKIIESKEI